MTKMRDSKQQVTTVKIRDATKQQVAIVKVRDGTKQQIAIVKMRDGTKQQDKTAGCDRQLRGGDFAGFFLHSLQDVAQLQLGPSCKRT